VEEERWRHQHAGGGELLGDGERIASYVLKCVFAQFTTKMQRRKTARNAVCTRVRGCASAKACSNAGQYAGVKRHVAKMRCLPRWERCAVMPPAARSAYQRPPASARPARLAVLVAFRSMGISSFSPFFVMNT